MQQEIYRLRGLFYSDMNILSIVEIMFTIKYLNTEVHSIGTIRTFIGVYWHLVNPWKGLLQSKSPLNVCSIVHSQNN